MAKKRILIHAPNLSTPGGKQTYYAAVRDHYQSDISFFFYGAQGKKESKLRTFFRLFGDYRKFRQELKSGKYDLVHLNPSLNLKSFFRDSLFSVICRMVGIKTVVFWHGWNWDFEKNTIQKIQWYFRWAYGQSDSMMVLAKEFETQLRSYGYKNKIYLETTVVDDTIFELFENSPKQLIPENGEPLVLLFLARLEKVKGVYEAIDSFEKVQQQYPNTILNIAGTGGELEAAKRYVTKKELQNINFLGWITGEQKAQCLIDAHIYILASYHGEGMPISLLEAMATGSSVVTTDVGGIKDFFEDKKMGYFVEAKNTMQLKEKLEHLIVNQEQIAQMGRYNTAYAKRRFTPAQVTKRLEVIYAETLGETIKKSMAPSKQNSQKIA